MSIIRSFSKRVSRMSNTLVSSKAVKSEAETSQLQQVEFNETYFSALDSTIGAIAECAELGLLSDLQEHALLSKVLQHHTDSSQLITFGKHYGTDAKKFAKLALEFFVDGNTLLGPISTSRALGESAQQPDVLIVGGGLGGLSAALAILDRGGRVVILDKETMFGGNSVKASSGINGVDDVGEKEYGDSIELFTDDVVKGSGIPEFKNNPLVHVLTEGSRQALEWLRGRVGLPLELRCQLGGHSVPRTHRPAKGGAGAEMVSAVKQEVLKFTKGAHARCTVMLKTEVVSLSTDGNGRVIGVKYRSKDEANGDVSVIHGANVILATGGFANDFGTSSLIRSNRPDLIEFSTTNGKFATGDGHKMAMASDIGAATVDMENIQLHPTGFVDRQEPMAKVKILCAEILRGVGGVLVDSSGVRFVNELGTRDYISDTMLENARQHGVGKPPKFGLIINSEAYSVVEKYVGFYMSRGLMAKVNGFCGVAEYLGVPVHNLQESLKEYDNVASAVVNGTSKSDKFGKTTFLSLPFATLHDHKNEVFYVGEVAPVLHYCMGGLKIDQEGRVLRTCKGQNTPDQAIATAGSNNTGALPGQDIAFAGSNSAVAAVFDTLDPVTDPDSMPIGGLFAVGEITGGIHGKNRLGGNALTECVVFGFRIGSQIALQRNFHARASGSSGADGSERELRAIKMEEVTRHNNSSDLWVVINGLVYDFTDFADDHPGGNKSVLKLAGKDGAAEFHAAHTDAMLDDFEPIGRLS